MKHLFLFTIRLYQMLISPLYPPVCRYHPTCSHYAQQAVKQYGVFSGMGLTLHRLFRCHPFTPGGYDPVP